MRAAVCPSAPISPTQLVYTTTHPTPQPKFGHVLIRVKGFGLNRSELFSRQGLFPEHVFPRILGIECVGVVKDGGGGQWKEGDIVAAIMGGMGIHFDGGYAEYTLVPHSSVSQPIKLPKNIGWKEFAAIPETFITAWGTLNTALNLGSTDTLYIHGGSSSLGLACASLAKSTLFNVSTVLSTTRSERKIATLYASGADHVILDTGSPSAEVKRLTGGVGGYKGRGDRTLSGGVWKYEFNPLASLAPSKHLTMFGSNTIDIYTAPLQRIIDAVGSGEIKLNVDKVFDIASVGEAHAYMEANSAAGKVVCLVD
ncbi:GroES-like protein [Mycena venus]|uniref:GroES-like protein n=1 Tax=Mycena venus TaxID=2733690 RepID=A0A8H7D6K7_9AGAR|nr:GroES-like protein [Mycena venus]